MESGGFTEKLYGARSQARKSDGADGSDKSDKPRCPVCGQAMLLRTARKGAKTGQPFWGCSGYPDCKGTLPAGSSDGADQSDRSDKRPRKTP